VGGVRGGGRRLRPAPPFLLASLPSLPLSLPPVWHVRGAGQNLKKKVIAYFVNSCALISF
jgi:hypothetical protein